MINYIIHFWVNVLILLAWCAWAVLFFWGAIWIAEKICRWMYQDAPRALLISKDFPGQGECRDCAMPTWPDAAGRCDLCAKIEQAIIDRFGFGSYPDAWEDYEEITAWSGEVIKRVPRP